MARPRQPEANEKAASQTVRTSFYDDFRLAAPAIGRIIHRNQLGDLVPFAPNLFQTDIFATVMRIRAFWFVRSLLRRKDSKLERTVFARILDGKPKKDYTFKELVHAVETYGPGKAFREVKEREGVSLLDVVRLILGKPRQIGASTALTWIGAHRTAFIPNHRGLITAHEKEAAVNIFQTLYRYFDAWPAEYDYCKPGLPSKQKERGALCTKEDSRIDVKTAGGGDIRSFKYDFLLLDECAHYDSDQAVSAITLAVPDHCWIFKLSTANGVSGGFYNDYKHAQFVDDVIDAFDQSRAIDKWNQYFKWFKPWFDDPQYRVPLEKFEEDALRADLSDYERALLEKYPAKVTLEHLAFRRARIGESKHPLLTPEQLFAQEFPATELEMFQNTGGQLFDGTMCDTLMAQAPEPVGFKLVDSSEPQLSDLIAANFKVWEGPIKGVKYTVGIDPSNHRPDGDASVICVLKRIDGVRREQVAEWRGRLPAGNVALAHVAALICEWYNGAFCVPESNIPTVVETMANVLHYPYIYKTQRFGSHREKFGSDQWDYGFRVDPAGTSSKKDLVNRLVYDFNNGNVAVRSPVTLEELKIFCADETGKYGAPEGYHDDGVMALCLASFGDSTLIGAPPIVDRPADVLFSPEAAVNRTLSMNDREWLAALAEEKKRMAKEEQREKRDEARRKRSRL